MAFPSKIVFPLPPPTNNSLTAPQRTQLMRSTKKLGRILGSTPHLVDDSNVPDPVRVHLPFDIVERYSFSRTSIESLSSTSSAASAGSSLKSLERRSSCSSSYSLSSTSTRTGSARSKKSTDSVDTSASWPARKPPMLRLAMPSPLETIPASPLPGSTPSIYAHSRSRSMDGYDDARFTIRPSASTSSPEDSPTSPQFAIPSASAERRQKMDRLRRKLGDGVPVDLVYPAMGEASPVQAEKELPLLPRPTPRAPKAPGRISYTRDSISSISPHRAPRKIVAPKASRPAPPPPAPTEVWHQREARGLAEIAHPYSGTAQLTTRDRLCSIMESPDEYGSEGSDSVGVSRTGTPSSLDSEWYYSDEDYASPTWCTRRARYSWSHQLFEALEQRRSPPNADDTLRELSG